MNQPPPQQPGLGGGSRKNRRRRKHKGADLWRPVRLLDEPAPIRPSSDPAALIRSLGDPPLQGQAALAEHYLAAVVERAATLSRALAAAGGMLAEADDELELPLP